MSIVLTLLFLAQSVSGVSQEITWKEFSSTEGRFSALMPTTPELSQTFTRSSRGNLVTNIISSEDSYRNSFSVSWTIYPQPMKKDFDIPKALAAAVNALATSKEARITSNQEVWKDGFRGCEVVMEREGRKTQVCFYFVKDHFFQVMAEIHNGNSIPDLQSGQKFMQSFRLAEGAPI